MALTLTSFSPESRPKLPSPLPPPLPPPLPTVHTGNIGGLAEDIDLYDLNKDQIERCATWFPVVDFGFKLGGWYT